MRNIIKWCFVVFVFNLIFLNFKAVANDSQAQIESSSPFNFDIFSLNKQKEDSFDSPSATYIVSSEDVRRSGATSIPEVLRLVPGVQVTKNDNDSWSISARGFNSQYSNKLLVMIDGRTIYTTLFSGVFWDAQDYPMEDIERIEVVKGTGGTIWGANAVNGVINIITKTASLTQGSYVSGLVGNQDANVEARYGNKTKDNNYYRVYAKHATRKALDKADRTGSNNDNFHSTHAGFRYDMKSIPGSDISIASDASTMQSDNYFATLNSFNSLKNNRTSKNVNLVANWNKILSKESNFFLQAYLDYTKFDLTTLEMATKVVDLDFQYFHKLNDYNHLIWGLGYRRITDSLEETPLPNKVIPLDYNPNNQINNTYSAFIQDKMAIIPDELYLTIGSKIERNDYTRYEYQPNAKLTYYPSENQTIWTSISRAIRTPTRGERGLVIMGGAQRGSKFYRSEDMVAYELGYRIKPTRTTIFDIASFFNDYTKLRTFDTTSSSPIPTAHNRGYGTSHGFEATAKWQVYKDWRLEAGYSFLRLNIHTKSYSTDTTTSALWYVNGQSPKNQVTLRSNYNITPKVEFDNILYYVDSLPSARSSPRNSTVGAVPAYIRFDTRIAYLPEKNLELSLVGQNLTDKRHQEFKSALFNNPTEVGRTVYAKVVWGF